jgi:CRP-like cAMP-binding protein
MCYTIFVKNLTLTSIQDKFPKVTIRSYRKGQIVCYEGDRPQHIFFVVKGHVRYYDIDDEGNEKILHIIGPGNLFPMLYAFNVTEEVSGFYASLDNVEMVAVPLAEFNNAVATDISFSNALTQWFLTEINQLVYRISSLQKTDARDKVLYAIRYLATDYGHKSGTWQQLDFPVTQQFLADLTGLARETVSSTMHELEADKIIRTLKAHRLDVKTDVLKEISY